MFEGVASRVTDDARLFHHEDGGSAAVFEVAPTKVLAFAKGQFAQTRYRFPAAHE